MMNGRSDLYELRRFSRDLVTGFLKFAWSNSPVLNAAQT
jgi:hypothetical protein